jgi:7,8-dihydro-6-hydroxymethylpterin-pyrophosphokinase
MHVAFIGLGSNLGNERNGIFECPKQQLLNAIQSIDNQTTIHLISTSYFYQTEAIGPWRSARLHQRCHQDQNKP